MFKRKKIVFVAHPYLRGYATLQDKKDENLVRSYNGSRNVNSHEFEKLQEIMQKDNISLHWK